LDLLRRLLTDPGSSFASYVLRMLTILLAGNLVVGELTGIIFRESYAAFAEMFETTRLSYIIFEGVIQGPLIAAAATWAGVSLTRRMTNNPFIAAGIVALVMMIIKGTVFGAMYVIAIGWAYFVLTIAFAVCRRSSLRAALFSSVLLFAISNAISILTWSTRV